MKAIKIQKNGGPEVLELKDVTLANPGNEEVLIQHVAIGLNYIDTIIDQVYILLLCLVDLVWKHQEL